MKIVAIIEYECLWKRLEIGCAIEKCDLVKNCALCITDMNTEADTNIIQKNIIILSATPGDRDYPDKEAKP